MCLKLVASWCVLLATVPALAQGPVGEPDELPLEAPSAEPAAAEEGTGEAEPEAAADASEASEETSADAAPAQSETDDDAEESEAKSEGDDAKSEDDELPFWAKPLKINLPGSLEVHGSFDVAYERRNYTNNPLDGDDNITSYHHFLFLTRASKDDPLGLNVEVITQAFYEISGRFTFGESDAWVLTAKAGKILVPFGGDPIFHKLYGGRGGFDQELLPVIWARHGADIQLQYRVQSLGLQLTNDIYVVEGYRLRDPAGVINLQGDFVSGPTQLGVGDRLGISWGPLTLWYSVYYNQIGFGRTLFMQALDFSLWRWPGVPVLEDMVLLLGVVRADVSGAEVKGYGGPGKDYYHFAHYLELGYYPLPWLYVRYRTGLLTFDNRRGFFGDESRFDERDGTSHNLGVIARYGALRAGVFVFWNLEKRNEQPDDFLRVTVGYDF